MSGILSGAGGASNFVLLPNNCMMSILYDIVLIVQYQQEQRFPSLSSNDRFGLTHRPISDIYISAYL